MRLRSGKTATTCSDTPRSIKATRRRRSLLSTDSPLQTKVTSQPVMIMFIYLNLWWAMVSVCWSQIFFFNYIFRCRVACLAAVILVSWTMLTSVSVWKQWKRSSKATAKLTRVRCCCEGTESKQKTAPRPIYYTRENVYIQHRFK